MCINPEGSPWVHRCGFADIIRTQRTDSFFGGQTYIVCTDHHPNMIKAAEKTPGLRTSCDRCQASKVRCTRSKPSCWRCSQSGQECVYSPLKRTGRPRRNIPPPMSSSAYSPALQGGNADCQAENAPPTQSKQGPAATSNATHTESNPSGRWQAADFPWVYNDLHMNWNTRDLDLQDIKLDGFDDLNPNTASGMFRVQRTIAATQVGIPVGQMTGKRPK
jgi:Fungal Zn(2)-Cys(6) binuclear cluster domain.